MENKTIKFSAIEEHAEWLGKFAHLACKVNSSSGTIDFYGLIQEQVELLNTGAGVSGWWINTETGFVDAGKEGIDWSNLGLTNFKGIKLGTVIGNFRCGNNQLTSLEGVPREVGVSFDCRNNQLTTLEGAPQKVNAHFGCVGNQLITLEGAPREVGGNFSCSNNPLTTLEGAPQKVGWGFDCRNNQLTTLEGAPREVGGNFSCSNNPLTTLEGAPREVGGSFDCSDNPLTTLEGAPREVGVSFNCENNQLTTLEGAPQKVGGDFYCYNNPVSCGTLESIFRLMEKSKSYLEAVESLWENIPPEDQLLLYRPGFKWVTPEKKRAAELLIEYNRIKEML